MRVPCLTNFASKLCGDACCYHRRAARARRRPDSRGGKPALMAPKYLQRQFNVRELNQSWVADITYIPARQDLLCLSVVINLFFWHVIVWSMGHRIDTELVLNALLMALWRRQSTRRCHRPLRSGQSGRIQPVVATPGCRTDFRYSFKVSAGVFQPSVLRGLLFKARATA